MKRGLLVLSDEHEGEHGSGESELGLLLAEEVEVGDHVVGNVAPQVHRPAEEVDQHSAQQSQVPSSLGLGWDRA
jgi:hypothetical protein